MNDEIDCEEKPQVNFYKLDKSKPYSFLGVHTSTNLFLAFAFFFSACTALVLGFGFEWFFKDTVSTLIPVFLIATTVIFWCASIWYHLRQKAKRTSQSAVFENCILTDGVILGVHKRKIQVNDNTTQDELELVYQFTDDKMSKRTASAKSRVEIGDVFFEGQNIMVAFTETESYVMTKYTLIKEDRQKFVVAEAARSDDDFDGLSNELLDIDLSKPIKSAEGNFIYKLLAIILAVMVVLYLIPIGFFVIPQFFDGGPIVPGIIVCVMALSPPVIVLSCVIALLYKYIKRQKRVKKIIKSNPYFTFGKMFRSENTYNGSSKKRMVYCYIDKWDERHTEDFHGVFSNVMANPREIIVIAYTADGRSVPLETFTFLYADEEYEYDEECEYDEDVEEEISEEDTHG